MRALMISARRSSVFSKTRVVPLIELSSAKWTMLVPLKCSSILAVALVQHPCAAGYSGCAGVVARLLQPGSAVVNGLPPPARIAVTGRQKLYLYLASQQAICESRIEVFAIAKNRAASRTLKPFSIA